MHHVIVSYTTPVWRCTAWTGARAAAAGRDHAPRRCHNPRVPAGEHSPGTAVTPHASPPGSHECCQCLHQHLYKCTITKLTSKFSMGLTLVKVWQSLDFILIKQPSAERCLHT